MKKILLMTICCLLALSTTAYTQSLDSTLQRLAGDAAKSYVSPIVSGFGSDLNAGWFHRAPSAKMFGIDLEFGFVAMGTFFAEENKSFATSGDFRFNKTQATAMTNFVQNYALPQNKKDELQNAMISAITGVDFNVGIAGPTIIGPKADSMKITFAQRTITTNTSLGSRTDTIPGQIIPLPVGGILDGVTLVPFFAPQLSIGTFVGTQFTFRYLPSVKVSADIGEFKYFGFGVQHNPGIWFPNPLPVDLSVSYFTQTLDVGTIFSTKTSAFGVNVSKRFGPGALNITPYAGFLIESSTMTFTYDYNVELANGQIQANHITFDLEGENKSRITLGLSLKILFLNVNADYNLGKYNSASAGLMFII